MKGKYILTILITLSTKVLWACPICLTKTGQKVREGIFNQSFWLYSFYTLLPFLCLFLIVFVVYLGKTGFYKDIRHEK